MAAAFYGAAVVLSFLMVFAYNDLDLKKNVNYEMVFLATLISNIGYFSISMSKTVEEAILANKLTYLGGCFLPLFLLMTLCDLCKHKVSKKQFAAMVTVCIAVLGCVWSVGYSNAFYEKVELGQKYGATYLIRTYGPLHAVYAAVLICYMALLALLVVHTYFKQKDVSHRTTMMLAAVVFFNILAYAAERVFHSRIEWMPFVYLLDEVILLTIIRKVSMYDMTNNVMMLKQQVEEYGYITFDLKKRYLGCNQFAKDYFPELNEYSVDYLIPKSEGVFYNEIMEKLLNFEETGVWEEFHVQCGAHSLKCEINYMHHGRKNRRIGYIVELADDTRQQSFIHLLNNYNNDLENKVEEKTLHIKNIQDKIIVSMADVVESRDDSTGGHIKRTSECVRIFVKKLRNYPEEYPYTEAYFQNIIKAAPMHDLGKIAVDDRILRKPGRYTQEEFEEMKRHSEKGAEIVRMVLENVEDEELLQIAVNVAHYHHEKWNGMGYPEGLKGEEIPLEARIMALADVFDALVSKRCYKEAYDFERAFKIIEESLGSHFDERLGSIFLTCKDELIGFYSRQFEEEEEQAVS